LPQLEAAQQAEFMAFAAGKATAGCISPFECHALFELGYFPVLLENKFRKKGWPECGWSDYSPRSGL